MFPESASFDGESVEVHYPANPKESRGWWDAPAMHKFSYHPELTSPKAVIEYATRGHRLTSQQRSELSKLIRPKTCGDGVLVEIDSTLVTRVGGRAKAGGKWPIFLLSPRGRLGTLVIGSNVYHRYNVKRMHVGKKRDFNWLPKLNKEQLAIEPFAFGVNRG